MRRYVPRYLLLALILVCVMSGLLSQAPTHITAPRPVAAAQPAPISFFGMNTYFTGLERIPPTNNDGEDGIATLIGLGREAGVPWAREEISWGNLERHRKGDPEWYLFDDRLLQMANAGYGIIGMISTTPGWARVADCAERVERYASAGFTTQEYWCPPANPADYADIVRATVERYDGDGVDDAAGSPRVAVWQLWNEPNAWETWPGTPAEYGNLLIAGYDAVKAADPTAIVVAGGVYVFDGSWDDGFGHQDGLLFMDRVLQAQPAAWRAFDVLAVHPFMPDVAPDQPGLVASITLWGRLTTTRAWLDQNTALRGGLPRPIWISEIGWSTCSTLALTAGRDSMLARYRLPTSTQEGATLSSNTLCKSEVEQANYMLRAHMIAMALGVQHVNYFQLEDKFDGAQAVWGGHSILDTRAQGYRKKVAYLAYAVMTHQIEGAVFGGIGPLHTYAHNQQAQRSAVGRFHLRFVRGTTIIDVLWRNQGVETLELPIEAGYNATLISRDGISAPLLAPTGMLRFTVGEEPIYVRQEVPSLPTATPTATPAPTVTPTPSATPTPIPTPGPTAFLVGNGSITMDPRDNDLAGWRLRYDTDSGHRTTVTVPTTAVTRTATLSYTALRSPTRSLAPGATFAGRAFTLDVFLQSVRQPGFQFAQSVTLTIEYDPAMRPDQSGRALRLYRREGDSWQLAGNGYQFDDPDDNRIQVRVNSVGEYALLDVAAEPYRIYLPFSSK